MNREQAISHLADMITGIKLDHPVRVGIDGIFLHRPELRKHWDFSVFVHADFDIVMKRAQKRNLHLFKTAEKVREIYEQRYIPGEQIYLDAESPFQRANLIWNNNDIENPELTINMQTSQQTNATNTDKLRG